MKILWIICLLIMTSKLLAQSIFFEKKQIIDDSTFVKYQYYLINSFDTFYRLEIFRNDKLFLRSYSRELSPEKIEGVTIRYFPNKMIEGVGVFKNGYAEGQHFIFYEEGELHRIVNYQKGIYVGDYIEYYTNGNIKLQGKYDYFESDKLLPYYKTKVGVWKSYYENGQIKEEQSYYSKPLKREKNIQEEYTTSDGLFDDTKYFTETDLPHGILDESSYKRNVKHGRWNYWNEKGELIKVESYDKNKLLKKGESPQK